MGSTRFSVSFLVRHSPPASTGSLACSLEEFFLGHSQDVFICVRVSVPDANRCGRHLESLHCQPFSFPQVVTLQ